VTAIDTAFVLADVSVWDFVLIAGVAFTMSVVGGLSGFGIGLVLPAFLAPVVGVVSVVPVMSVAMTFANASRVWAYWKSLAPRRLLLVMITALPASAVTAFLYTRMSSDAIAAMLGLFLIAAVPLRRLLGRWKFTLGDRGLMAIGTGYGLLTGALSGAGMLMVAALLAAGVTGGALVGTDAAISTAMNLMKIAVFGGSSLLNGELFMAGVLIGLCTVPGAFVARRIMDRLPIHVHLWIMETLIVAGGVSFLWQAFRR
jgi:uncharacterized membrane protein YfcA